MNQKLPGSIVTLILLLALAVAGIAGYKMYLQEPPKITPEQMRANMGRGQAAAQKANAEAKQNDPRARGSGPGGPRARGGNDRAGDGKAAGEPSYSGPEKGKE